MALSTGALTLLATVKTELGISVSTYDTQLERMIEAASDQVEGYCNRTFSNNSALVELVPAYGYTHLRLSRTPLVSITSVVLDGTTIASADYSIHDANAGILEKRYGWGWTASVASGAESSPVPGTERKAYTVTYNGGYVNPNQAGTRTLPYDLEDAVIQLVVAKYRAAGRDPYVTSETIGAASESRGGVSSSDIGIPASVKIVLDRYKKHASARV